MNQRKESSSYAEHFDYALVETTQNYFPSPHTCGHCTPSVLIIYDFTDCAAKMTKERK